MAKPKSAVNAVADAMRNKILTMGDGQLLGSEEALLAEFGVSRPTLRQAASLVAEQQLLTVKRGVGGGYFARFPDARAVSRSAALYLKIHRAEVQQIVLAFMPIRVEIARLAAHCEDIELRRKLAQFVEAEEALADGVHLRDFLSAERRFNALIGEMSGNKALSLFLEILLDLAAMVDRQQDMYTGRPERVKAYRAGRNRLAQEILAGDAEMAALAARRCAEMSRDWLLQDIAERGESELGELVESDWSKLPLPSND
ncbi:FadR/GntR family transcriptional regulator [Paracoccus pantotrophus]|uniref:FadR/GntR family transcriptional regulator n=1 Tax=Paracoccus pantotrophus TaxID=82367 RepID=UPI000491785F|nr:FCD domain-containing protein [Paracoccus pantotrophus]